MENPKWWLYIIQTQRGKLYTGVTTDPDRRFEEHLEGRGARFFRLDPPQEMVYLASFENRSLAQKEEYSIKQESRAQKLKRISEYRSKKRKGTRRRLPSA